MTRSTPAEYSVTVSISPIFTADSVTITVSREKDGKLRTVKAGWDDYKVAQPDEGPAASGQLAGRGGPNPASPAGGALTPLKN